MSMTITSRLDPQLGARLTSVIALPGVRAGSGLLAVGHRLLAIQDDAEAVVWIDPQSGARETLVLRGHGAALPKRDKPDYEALLQTPDGRVHLLGSGSRPNRCGIACLRPDGEAWTVDWREAHGLYAAVAAALGVTPNIEGALHLGDGLRLLHRGAADQPDAWLDLPADALDQPQPPVLGLRWLQLGSLGGVPLHLTDAARLADGRLLYLAAAENTPDAVADGPVCGAAIGVIDGDTARWAPLTEPSGLACLRKAEGIVIAGDGRCGHLITDPDDPARPAELCGFSLHGPW